MSEYSKNHPGHLYAPNCTDYMHRGANRLNWVYNDYYHEWINLDHVICLRVQEMKEDFCVYADLSCINTQGDSDKILFSAKSEQECHEWIKKFISR